MVLLGLLDPEDVVEQQVLTVGRGQAPMGKPGTADDDLAQGTGFRVDTEFRMGIHVFIPNFEEGHRALIAPVHIK